MLQQAHDHWTPEDHGGVVVTGQPGIGKTYFLYYLLFRRLSERRPVALEQPEFFILFHEGGVYRYPLKADARYLPDGTWALSDSNDEAPKPCTTFRSASKLRTAWLIQTTSPVETRWRDWRKYCKAGMFVMNHVSIEDITALSVSDVSNIQRLYRKWGPSARTCLDLLQFGAEAEHEHSVDGAACRFVQDPPKILNFDFDESKVSHRLFSIRPKDQDRTGRRIQIAEIATEHIQEVISYAVADADAEVQIKFFQMISTYPSFRGPAGRMFEGFVLSWLYARPNTEPLRCFANNQAHLEIPACGRENTTFFDRKSALKLKDVNGHRPPFCLLPNAQNFPTADAIVITHNFVITIQVTVSGEHGANADGFKEIKNLIPASLKKIPDKKNKRKKDKPWRHVFITHSDNRAESLRDQNLPGLPVGALVYSGVFDILRSGVTREHVEAFNENKTRQQSGNSMEVD
ncbi:hypothetical protein EDB92DRAFT_2003024 [Lactarius akahatsu]|uniref:Uncharacterized protein n=1 Tax=Lactarius akahatsu TaxID=416441 RepID=A0AAD4LDJ5_9AGAM|nr:hypothetical protein EDB92DRAFT_2003024 [Lactarius akahatsu]